MFLPIPKVQSEQRLVSESSDGTTEKATFCDCPSTGAQGGREAAQLEAVVECVLVECVLEQMGLLRESSLGPALVTLVRLHKKKIHGLSCASLCTHCLLRVRRL